MKVLIKSIRQCSVCLPYLKNGVNPVMAADPKSKVAIIGQAPGRIVHETSVPWDDKSGERLRAWLGVDDSSFYDVRKFAIVPMGFCYPGKGKSGDLPPRKECAPLWHEPLFQQMKRLQLRLLIGSYAQNYYLRDQAKRTLTETVRNYKEYLPEYLPLPHPSPRNNIWFKKNIWFEEELLPELRKIITQLL